MMIMNTKPSFKKTNSFPIKSHPSPNSMDQQPPPTTYHRSPPAVVHNHHRPIEFPTSPDVPEQGDEIYHATHPQHPIYRTHLPDLFTCAACKEVGAGCRFNCTDCDYQLHDFCALAPPALKRHPIHPFHKLILFNKPVKGGILKSGCDICAKPTKGSVFKCSVCNFQMHPCCAMLSTEIFNILVHPHTLRLLPIGGGQSSSTDSAGFVCGECTRRRSGRVYNCTICDYHLHAVCAKNTVNGLKANGFKGTEKPNNMIGTAARVASQVVKEFIGGLIEGLGEGVGQVLIQTAIKGSPRCPINSSPRIA